MMAVVPWVDSATLLPCSAALEALAPISLAFCDHTPAALRVNTHVAPVFPWSPGPPIRAVWPSLDNATLLPCRAAPIELLAARSLPCCFHTPLLRVKTHAAPTPTLLPGSPTKAVLPSPDSATEAPRNDVVLVTTSGEPPCGVQTPLLRV